MTALATTTSENAIAIDTIETYVLELGERSKALAKMDLAQLHREATTAELMAELAGKYAHLSDVADRAQSDLDAFALDAKRYAGKLLEKLPSKPGSKGRGRGGTKSERGEAAAVVGIKPDDAKRYVALAKIDDAKIDKITERVRTDGGRLTLGTVLRVAKERISEADNYQSDEWYTPENVTGSVHKVFGGPPDDDPASCAVAQMVIKAKRWWCGEAPKHGPNEQAAGLTDAKLGMMLRKCGGISSIYHCETGVVIEPDLSIHDAKARVQKFAKMANAYGRIEHASQLRGKVYLNPPYAFPAPFIRAVIEGYIGRTLEEAASEYAAEIDKTEAELDAAEETAATWRAEAAGIAAAKYGGKGRITEVIILVNVAPGTAIQQHLLAAASAACWFAGRLAFRDAIGVPRGSNRYEQVAFYLGKNWTAFAAEFSKYGQISKKAA